MGERRGWTVRWRGRSIARIIKPSRRVRIGKHGQSISVGFLIVRWF